MKQKRKLGLMLVVFLGLILVAQAVPRLKVFWLGSREERLQRLLEEDFEQLKQQGKWPAQWQQVREISWASGSATSSLWVKHLHLPIHLSKDGKYRLEIFVDHYFAEQHYGAILKIQTVEIATNNTVHEMGRTLELGQVKVGVSLPAGIDEQSPQKQSE